MDINSDFVSSNATLLDAYIYHLQPVVTSEMHCPASFMATSLFMLCNWSLRIIAKRNSLHSHCGTFTICWCRMLKTLHVHSRANKVRCYLVSCYNDLPQEHIETQTQDPCTNYPGIIFCCLWRIRVSMGESHLAFSQVHQVTDLYVKSKSRLFWPSQMARSKKKHSASATFFGMASIVWGSCRACERRNSFGQKCSPEGTTLTSLACHTHEIHSCKKGLDSKNGCNEKGEEGA